MPTRPIDPAVEGGIGRAVIYRPPRTTAGEIFSPDAQCAFVCDGRKYPVLDLSMGGFLFASPNGAAWEPGSEIKGELELHGERVLSSTVRVARVQRYAKGTRVGVDARQPIAIADMVALDAERNLQRSLERGPTEYTTVIPEVYLQIVGEIRDVLQYYKHVLDEEESRLRKKGSDHLAFRSLAQAAFEALKVRWRELVVRASQAASEFLDDPMVLVAARRYTERTITSLLINSPMLNRTYTKPLGYAGDCHVMDYYYRDDYEGPTVYDQVFHRLMIQNPLARGVITRARYMVDVLDEEHGRVANQARSQTEFRVANLGCGPGREVEFWAQTKRDHGPVHWTLIDQEEEALALAYEIGHSAIHAARRAAEIQPLHVSFGELLRSPDLFNFPSQNFIFSTGLFDYLHTERGQVVIRTLYNRLVPGGLLAVGNAIGPNDYFWPPELMSDWPIIYRSEDEMHELAGRLPKSAETEVVVEPGQAYYFLRVRKA